MSRTKPAVRITVRTVEDDLTVSYRYRLPIEKTKSNDRDYALKKLQAQCSIHSDTLQHFKMVLKLSEMNTETVLLTGDDRKAANYLASKIGITEVRAELLPEEKVENVEAMRKAGHRVCMIGDGVNDVPALKSADVSVAMGSMGSDIAVDAADIALMSDDISKIPYLKRLSNATVKTIKASITLSMCINAAAIILSLLGLLNPTTGALVHNAGSCFVVLIAALLYDRKFE